MSFEDWVRALPLNKDEKSLVLKIFNDEGIGLADLLPMQSKKELAELEIGLTSESIAAIWFGINEVKGNNKDSNNESNNNSNDNCAPDGEVDEDVSVEDRLPTYSEASGEDKNVNNKINEYMIERGGMTGLTNMGNTCFMNSAIQCLLHIPGFTDRLAGEIGLNSNNGGTNVSESKVVEQTKEEWIHDLQRGDFVDVLCVGYKKPKWYGAEVVSIDFRVKHNNNNNRNNRNNKKKKKNKQQILEHKIKIKYRSFHDDFDVLDFLQTTKNIKTINRIDKPNTHAHESAYCDHWRHDLTQGDKVDFYNNLYPYQWEVGTVGKYIQTQGFEIFYGNWCKVVSRYNKDLIAPLGSHTTTTNNNNINNSSWLNVNFNVGGYSFSYNNGGNENGKGKGKGKGKGTGDVNGGRWSTRMTFFEAWLRIINRVHLKKNNKTFSPRAIHDQMSNNNPELGDGRQHDAIEALTVILNGIKESLPQGLRYVDNNSELGSELYPFVMKKQSIYDNDFQWDNDMDNQICNKLIETSKLNFGSDIVSEYFQGIECICETCLNCGTQRRLYHIFNELSLPVTSSDEYVNVNFYYYSPNEGKYLKKCVKTPTDCTVGVVKFLALCKMFNKSNIVNKLDSFELICVNEKFNDINLNTMANFATILVDNQGINKYYSPHSAFLVVPKISIRIGEGINVNGGINGIRAVYVQLNNNQILFCVLSFPSVYFNHKWFKQELQHIQKKHKFLTHFGNNNNNNNNNDVVNYINGGFSTYCDGAVNQDDEDEYSLTQFGTNKVIVGYFDRNGRSRKASDTMNMSTNNNNNNKNKKKNHSNKKQHKQSNSKHGSVTDECDSKIDDRDVCTNISTMSNSHKLLVHSIMNLIKTFNSAKEAIEYLEKKIKVLEQAINDTKNKKNNGNFNNNNRNNFNGDNCKSRRWYCKLEGVIETSVPNQVEKDHLEAHKIVLTHLYTMQSDRRDIVLSIQEKIHQFWKKYKISRVSNIDSKETNKQFNDLRHCLEEYQSIKYMQKQDLAPPFGCKCNVNQTVPFVESVTSIIRFPKALIVSLARGKGSLKRNHNINFAETLVLPQGNKYDLRAVCNHLSDSTSYGHYTASVKQLGSDKWFECDDSNYYNRSRYSTKSAVMMIYTKT